VSTVSRLRRSPIWLTTTLDSARTQGVLRQDDVLVDIGVRLTAETACSRIALQTPGLDAQQGDLYGNCGYLGGTLRKTTPPDFFPACRLWRCWSERVAFVIGVAQARRASITPERGQEMAVRADKSHVERRTQPAGIERDQRLPTHLAWCVVALCALPPIMSVAGVDFGWPDRAPNLVALSQLAPAARIDALRYCPQGRFLH